MSGTRKHLLDHLRSLTPEQLAKRLMRQTAVFRYYGTLKSLEQLAQTLLMWETVQVTCAQLNLPERQVLAGMVRCAETEAELPGAWMYNGKSGVVKTSELLAAFGAGQSGDRYEAMCAAIEGLTDSLLIWPIGSRRRADGVPEMLGIAGPVLELFAHRQGVARSIDRAMTSCFNKTEVMRIAELLGVGFDTDNRTALQKLITAYFSDPGLVIALVDGAPPRARDHLEKMAATTGRMGSSVFRQTSYGSGKWTIDLGYVDEDTLWLAERGLVMPCGHDLIELPQEILQALTDGRKFPLSVRPAPVATVEVDSARVQAEAQTAILSSMRKLTRVMEAFDAAPGVMRKTGGLAVRETRRLAKLLEIDEYEIRFWIDLLAAAELIEVVDQEPPIVCPTKAYDAWLAESPARRFVAIIRAWLDIPDVLTLADGTDQTPVPLYLVPDPGVKELRHAVLAALAGLPDGAACIAPKRAAETGVLEESEALRLSSLCTAAAWQAPDPFAARDHGPILAVFTLYEAELLGLTALGAPTALGRQYQSNLESMLDQLLPAPVTRARFQADLTAVVPGNPAQSLASLLDTVADRESEGHAIVWRLSAKSVRRGLDAGRTADDLLSDLDGAADGQLPQPLVYLIKDVARSHGRMRVVRSACCIRSDDEALLSELVGTKALVKLGLRRIAPTVLISIRPPAETLALLRMAGFSPTLEAETGTTVVERVVGQRAPKREHYFSQPGLSQEEAITTAKALLGARIP